MMRRHFIASALALLPSMFSVNVKAKTGCSMPAGATLRLLNDTKTLDLCTLTQGKVCLLVNVASHCGFTYQYEGLEKLYQAYKDKGLMIIGFPSSDFFQEKDKEADIAQFCQLNYGVTFPMAEKIHVRGEDAHPIFKWLQAETDTSVKWNFYKFLLDRNGKPVKAFGSMAEPNDKTLVANIEGLL